MTDEPKLDEETKKKIRKEVDLYSHKFLIIIMSILVIFMALK